MGWQYILDYAVAEPEVPYFIVTLYDGVKMTLSADLKPVPEPATSSWEGWL